MSRTSTPTLTDQVLDATAELMSIAARLRAEGYPLHAIRLAAEAVASQVEHWQEDEACEH